MRSYQLLLFIFIINTSIVYAQSDTMEIALYPADKIPNSIPGSNEEKSVMTDNILRISNISIPTLSVFLPDSAKATGTAVLICPGGGYGIVAIDHEGYAVAKKFTEMGVAAFVLKYRLPSKKHQPDPSIAPLQDAQQAIITIRNNASKWNIDPKKVGVMGFSAGGHLASTVGTHFEKTRIDNPANLSVRPDFMLLIYPVISADKAITHTGSYKNLLGENSSETLLDLYSNEKQVTTKTPPTFLLHASDDKVVSSNNSVVFYQALIKNNVPAELHIYERGGHGFGLSNKTTKDKWMDRVKNWMEGNGWLKELGF